MLKICDTPFMKNFKSWALPILATLIIVKLLNTFVFIIAFIPSSSMRNTLVEGDKVLCVNPYFLNELERGDIVVFEPKGEDAEIVGSNSYWIKRIIGLPGDKVRIEGGEVFINNEKQQEPYVVFNESYTASFVVPKGKYLVLGDNRADSFDGRKWKNPFIEQSQVKFKAMLKVYPFDEIEKLY